MPAYKDTYLVWCYMVQMMRGGVKFSARQVDQAPAGIGPEWLTGS
jgi:hypothetical protein